MKTGTIHVCEEIRRLASLFDRARPLYVVGGYVRDSLKGTADENGDIDLTGDYTPEELSEIVARGGYGCQEASKRLGTMIVKGKRNYEFTSFRKDSYPVGSGAHRPERIAFTHDLREDAKRRDFKCNAIYYDPIADLTVDPLNGIEDVKNGVLSATEDPDKILGEDGLRILRLFRFVSQLGFVPEEKTLQAAQRLAVRLTDVSAERIAVELNKILAGDNRFEALRMMRDSGVLKIVLPELAAGEGMAQPPLYHCFDVLEHSFYTVEYAPEAIRMAALLHDVGKPFCMSRDGNYYLHALEGARIARDILERYRYPRAFVQRTCDLIALHMRGVGGKIKPNKIRMLVADYADLIDDLADLTDADALATGKEIARPTFGDCLRQTKREMIGQGIPFAVKDLAIGGKELIALGVAGRQIGLLLEELRRACILGQIANTAQALTGYCVRKIGRKGEKEGWN